jgi:hypothetical protein
MSHCDTMLILEIDPKPVESRAKGLATACQITGLPLCFQKKKKTTTDE